MTKIDKDNYNKRREILKDRSDAVAALRGYARSDPSAEKEKLERIAKNNPGSPCTEKHLVSNTEFIRNNRFLRHRIIIKSEKLRSCNPLTLQIRSIKNN